MIHHFRYNYLICVTCLSGSGGKVLMLSAINGHLLSLKKASYTILGHVTIRCDIYLFLKLTDLLRQLRYFVILLSCALRITKWNMTIFELVDHLFAGGKQQENLQHKHLYLTALSNSIESELRWCSNCERSDRC